MDRTTNRVKKPTPNELNRHKWADVPCRSQASNDLGATHHAPVPPSWKRVPVGQSAVSITHSRIGRNIKNPQPSTRSTPTTHRKHDSHVYRTHVASMRSSVCTLAASIRTARCNRKHRPGRFILLGGGRFHSRPLKPYFSPLQSCWGGFFCWPIRRPLARVSKNVRNLTQTAQQGESAVTPCLSVPNCRLFIKVPRTRRGRKRSPDPYLPGRVFLSAGARHSWETRDGTTT